MAEATPPAAASLPSVVDWRKFLTDYPPATRASVEGAVEEAEVKEQLKVVVPELQLYCDGNCQGMSYCRGKNVTGIGSNVLFPSRLPPDGVWDCILIYSCQKCQIPVKSYAVRVLGNQSILRSSRTADAAKLGEWPMFSPPTPTRVNSLVGPDRELFFKGRRSEAEGLGVGAFAYYRRIVEDQKNRLLDAIIAVARRTNAPAESIGLLENARAEKQFNKAVDMVKDVVPQSLRIKDHNPLTLLHSALSRNLHGGSDEECLRDAHAIRVILFGLAERLDQALKDEKELGDAISHLLNPE
jgi:hypothetical protein